jgi:hypothetical protein
MSCDVCSQAQWKVFIVFLTPCSIMTTVTEDWEAARHTVQIPNATWAGPHCQRTGVILWRHTRSVPTRERRRGCSHSFRQQRDATAVRVWSKRAADCTVSQHTLNCKLLISITWVMALGYILMLLSSENISCFFVEFVFRIMWENFIMLEQR